MRLRRAAVTATVISLAATVAVAPAAVAATGPDLGAAILGSASLTGVLVTDPSGGQSTLVATTAAAGFPRSGGDYAILSTGSASDAFDAPQDTLRDTNFRAGARTAGGSDFDATVLRVDFVVPDGANCMLGVDFRFLSEEYPEFVGDSTNDAFILEVDASTWTTSGSTIVAPGNIAFTPNGTPVSINGAGLAGLSAANAVGTAYDGATDLLTAASPMSPGPHSLFFSIFDQGDGRFDSAVFIDNLRIGRVSDPATQCRPGAGAATEDVAVVAPAPTFTDPYGTADDTYTIPTAEGVVYSVDGATVAAGPHPGSGTVTVTASAAPGYVLQGTSTFTFAFTDIQPVTAIPPTFTDTYGTAEDTFTIPAVTGVSYSVGGVIRPAGTYPGSGTVVVTAAATAGYELIGPSEFSFTYTDIRQASATPPTFTDPFGTALDAYTIPVVEGVEYSVDGAVVAAGTYPGSGTVVVTAAATTWYELTGPSEFSYTYTDILEATAVPPTFTDPSGTAQDTYTIPSVLGVMYSVGGVPVAAGTYPGTGTVVVTATAGPGYELTGATEFRHTFSAITVVSAAAPSVTDAEGVAQDTYTIPSVTGVRYLVDGAVVAAGTHRGSGTVVVTAVALEGFELSGPTTFTLTFTGVPSVATAVVAALAATGATLPLGAGLVVLTAGMALVLARRALRTS